MVTPEKATLFIKDKFPTVEYDFSGPAYTGEGDLIEVTKNRKTDHVVIERFKVDLSNGIFFHTSAEGDYFESGLVDSIYFEPEEEYVAEPEA